MPGYRVKERWRWDPDQKKLVQVPVNSEQASRLHYVIPDTPDYVSPVTGLVVSGRKQRREDLKRTGSRPYEGREQEEKEAAKYRAEQAAKSEKRLEEGIRRVYHQLSPEKRRILEGR